MAPARRSTCTITGCYTATGSSRASACTTGGSSGPRRTWIGCSSAPRHPPGRFPTPSSNSIDAMYETPAANDSVGSYIRLVVTRGDGLPGAQPVPVPHAHGLHHRRRHPAVSQGDVRERHEHRHRLHRAQSPRTRSARGSRASTTSTTSWPRSRPSTPASPRPSCSTHQGTGGRGHRRQRLRRAPGRRHHPAGQRRHPGRHHPRAPSWNWPGRPNCA